MTHSLPGSKKRDLFNLALASCKLIHILDVSTCFLVVLNITGRPFYLWLEKDRKNKVYYLHVHMRMNKKMNVTKSKIVFALTAHTHLFPHNTTKFSLTKFLGYWENLICEAMREKRGKKITRFSRTDKLVRVPVTKPSDLLSLSPGTHIVGKNNHPKTDLWCPHMPWNTYVHTHMT